MGTFYLTTKADEKKGIKKGAYIVEDRKPSKSTKTTTKNRTNNKSQRILSKTSGTRDYSDININNKKKNYSTKEENSKKVTIKPIDLKEQQENLKARQKQRQEKIAQNTKEQYGNQNIMQTTAKQAGQFSKKAGQGAKKVGRFLTDFDYRNKVGEKALMGAGTALSQFSKGALKTVENWGDAARSKTDDFNNWVAYKTGIIDKKEYDRQRKISEESIAADAVGDFWKNNLGWNEENARALNDYSYVTENNLLGQLSYGLGQQAPALMIGNTQAVQNLMTNPALQSVAGDGAVKNIAKGLIKNAPMNLEIGARSYGGAVEEALQNGATMEQARRYGLLNAGTEIATEWMTGGIPGVENTTGLFDKGVDAVIDKTTGKLTKETSKAIAKSLLSYGFDALGEGLEEVVSEIFSPLIKNMTYSNGEKIDWNSVLNAGIMGMLQGGILNAPSAVANARSDINQARQIDRINQEAARQQAEQQTRQELNTAAQSRLNEVYQQQDQTPIFNQQNRMMELAQQQVQAIQQQVQSGQISPQEGTQQIQDIQRYIQSQEAIQQQEIENEAQQNGNLVQDYMNDNYESMVGDYIDENYGQQTQQDNINTQEQQNVTQNTNNEVEEKQQYNEELTKDGSKRVDDHTLEYNGYYIKSAKPNVGYNYKTLENSNDFQIYDANNDDITHQVAGNIMNIDDAKQWIDDVGNLNKENDEVEQKPTNVGKHYGDLGKAHDTNYFAMNGSRRGTGHFGTGTYFVSNDYEVGPNSTYAKRPVNTASFDGYNLATPKTAQDGFDLHDALKEINYNNTPISKELYDKLLPYYEASFGTTNSMLDEESFNDYKNIRNLLKQAGVETEEFNGDSYSRYERDLEDKITDVLNNYDRFSRAEKDLKRILGVSDEQFNKAIEKVKQVKNEYNNYNDDQKLTADSLSTIFMKELGYEGVDVRHLKGLNDTEFGSVIYDLKNNKRETNQQALKTQKAEETFKNIKTKEDMDKLISNLKNKVENIKTGEDLKNTFKEVYDIYKVYNKSNYIYEVVEKDGLYGTKFESEFYNPDIKYKPLNEEIKIQKENLDSWLSQMQNDVDKIVYDNQDKVTPTIGKNINSLDEVTPITTDDFKNKLHDYIDKETEDIKGKFESDNGHLFRGGKEVKYLYRAINQAEMDSIKNSGYIKSNQSKNIGYEIEQGLTDFKDGYPGFYLPRNADGYILKIEVKPENGFFYDSDEYAKTPNQIPASQIVEINGEKINNLKTNVENTQQQDNISKQSEAFNLGKNENVETQTEQQQSGNLVEDYMNEQDDNLVNDYMNNYEDGNMVENFMNAQNELQQAQQDNIKQQTNAFNLGKQEQNNFEKQNTFEKMKEDITTDTIKATIAPYYDTPLTKDNYSEIKNKVDTVFKDTASKIVNMLDGKIKQTTNNIGGFTFSEGENAGNWVKELSYTFELENMSRENAKLFSSLMGDLAYEQQEAVIAATYSNDIDSSNALEFRLKYKDIEELMNALDKFGIHDYTIDTNNKTLQLLEFDLEQPYDTVQKITQLAKELGGDESDGKFTGIQSDYIDKDVRRGIYKEWLEANERGKENRELYSLVKEAYEKVNVQQEGTSDSSFSNEQTNTPETKNEQSIKIELTGVPKNQIKTENTGISIGNKPVQIEVPINSSQNKLGQYVPKDGFTKKELKNGKVGDSKFYKNVTERADFISDEVREQVQSDDYIKHHRKITNDESMQMAFDDLNTRGTEAIADFFNNDKELTSKDTAMGWLLIEQSQANGDYNFSNQVLRKMRSSATKTGQAMQMYNYYARLTPEGMYRWCGDQLLRAEEIFEKNKTKKWIEANKNRWQLNGEEVEFIKDQMEKVQKLNKMNDNDTTTIDIKGKAKKVTVDRAKQVEIAKIQAMIENKIPHQKGQALNAWMRISMLGNLKTIGTRNPLGNIALRPVNDVGDFVSSLVDYAISKKTGVRTKGKLNIKAQAKGFKKGGSEAVQDFRLGIDTKNQKGNRFEIGQGKSFNENHIGAAKVLNPLSKTGNKADSGVSFLLDLGDRPFYEAAYAQSLENQMKLNGIEKVEDASEWMKKIAEQEALERTYQDDNNYTAAVVDIRKAMNKFNVKGYGLGDVIIPFAKTPANLTKAIVDYSPAGFVSALTKGNELRTAINNEQFTPEMQHRFVNQLGKATAGTILYVIGAALANSGLITGGADEDDDVADFMRNTLGIQPYSIKIGNKSFTYDWAQPVASSFAIPADIKKGIQDAKNQEVDLQYIIHKSFSTAGNILLEQSFLQGIKEVLGGYGDPLDNLMSEIEGLPARAVPTLFQQIVTYLDPTKRMSYGNKGIQNVISQAIAKTPFAKDLPIYRNTMGKEVKMYGGKNSFFNVFINPSNYSEGNATKSAEEIYAIYQATNDKTILPRTVGNDLRNEDGTKLTNQQKSDFLKISGDFIDENVEKLTKSNEYKNMSNEDKAATIKYIVDYAYNKARKEITGHKLNSEHQKTENAEKSGYTMADYFISKKVNKKETSKSTASRNRYEELQQKGIDGRTFDDFVSFVKKTRGDSKKGGLSKKQKIINYIQDLPLTAKQKQSLWEDYKENNRIYSSYN